MNNMSDLCSAFIHELNNEGELRNKIAMERMRREETARKAYDTAANAEAESKRKSEEAYKKDGEYVQQDYYGADKKQQEWMKANNKKNKSVANVKKHLEGSLAKVSEECEVFMNMLERNAENKAKKNKAEIDKAEAARPKAEREGYLDTVRGTKEVTQNTIHGLEKAKSGDSKTDKALDNAKLLLADQAHKMLGRKDPENPYQGGFSSPMYKELQGNLEQKEEAVNSRKGTNKDIEKTNIERERKIKPNLSECVETFLDLCERNAENKAKKDEHYAASGHDIRTNAENSDHDRVDRTVQNRRYSSVNYWKHDKDVDNDKQYGRAKDQTGKPDVLKMKEKGFNNYDKYSNPDQAGKPDHHREGMVKDVLKNIAKNKEK